MSETAAVGNMMVRRIRRHCTKWTSRLVSVVANDLQDAVILGLIESGTWTQSFSSRAARYTPPGGRSHRYHANRTTSSATIAARLTVRMAA
jgi:hypothetical protein